MKILNDSPLSIVIPWLSEHYMNYLLYQEEHSTLFQPSLFFWLPIWRLMRGREEGRGISCRGILQIPGSLPEASYNGHTHFHTDGIRENWE